MSGPILWLWTTSGWSCEMVRARRQTAPGENPPCLPSRRVLLEVGRRPEKAPRRSRQATWLSKPRASNPRARLTTPFSIPPGHRARPPRPAQHEPGVARHARRILAHVLRVPADDGQRLAEIEEAMAARCDSDPHVAIFRAAQRGIECAALLEGGAANHDR